MSCSEMGSHNRPRALVITRSTARRCAATVSSRDAGSGICFVNTLVTFILSQRLAQLGGNGNRNHLLALALHAGDLLLAASHQLLMPPVLELHRDTVLDQFTEMHA